jgi:hypothetical protein
MHDAIELDSEVARMPLFPLEENRSSPFANDTLYSLELKGSQMYAAKGSGRGDGGVQNDSAATFD